MEDSGLQGMATFPHFPNKCDFPVMEKVDNKTACDHLLKVEKRRPLERNSGLDKKTPITSLFLDV